MSAELRTSPVELSPDDHMTLHELLGVPIRLGRQLVRLSSVAPDKGIVRLHNATVGERQVERIDEFLTRWRTIGEYAEELFPEDAVLSEPGARAVAVSIGPRGGITPLKRPIPKGSTR